MADLVNCHSCGSRERPSDVARPHYSVEAIFCPDCQEIEESYLLYLAECPPHHPRNIHGTPMTADELRAWGLPLSGWRSF